MGKKSVCLLMTIIGLIIIIGVQTFITIKDNDTKETEEYIKKNLVIYYKECIKDEVCEKEDTTIKFLIKNKYIKGTLLVKLKDYSLDSYITYEDYEVVLKK